jgi:hypothetical protein
MTFVRHQGLRMQINATDLRSIGVAIKLAATRVELETSQRDHDVAMRTRRRNAVVLSNDFKQLLARLTKRDIR